MWADKFIEKLTSDGSSSILCYNEEKVFTQVEEELTNVDEGWWTSIDDDLFFPKDKVHKDNSGVGIGRSIGVVHTSPERLLAW